jgi:multisubunit Na+/H+ antiporter MnhG subunit
MGTNSTLVKTFSDLVGATALATFGVVGAIIGGFISVLWIAQLGGREEASALEFAVSIVLVVFTVAIGAISIYAVRRIDDLAAAADKAPEQASNEPPFNEKQIAYLEDNFESRSTVDLDKT